MAKFVSDIRVGNPQAVDYSALRQLARSAPDAFMARVSDLIADGEISLRKIKDIKALYRALFDVRVTVMAEDASGFARAITASAFPVLTGNVIIKAVNDAYESLPTVGQDLVEEMEDDEAVTVIARIDALDKAEDKVRDGEEFPEISASEETVTIGEWPNGRRLTITDTMIRRNQIADIVRRVDALGRIAGTFVEELTLKRVTDLYGSASVAAAPYVYQPQGSGATLYSATANTPGVRAPSGTRYTTNALADETDLDNVRGRLASMRSDLDKPLPININECVLLVPDALIGTAMKIKGTEYKVASANNDINNWGPKGPWSGYKVLSSAYLDRWSTSAWYFGQFNKQFVRKTAVRMRTTTLGTNTESYLKARIAFQASMDWNVEIGATDYVWVVQCLSSTTPPTVSNDG